MDRKVHPDPHPHRIRSWHGGDRDGTLNEVAEFLDPVLLLNRVDDTIIGFDLFRFFLRVNRRDVVSRCFPLADRPIVCRGAIKGFSGRGMRRLNDLKNCATLRTGDPLAIEVEKERATAQAAPASRRVQL